MSMKKDWEPVFTNWTKPPSDSEDARANNAVSMIKKAIDADEELAKMHIEVFAQGSYANNTNVRLHSDVDVCVRNMDYLFCAYPEGKSQSDYGLSDSDYTFSKFKGQVEFALVKYFGRNDVTRGNKAIDIKSNTYRVEADVVPCYEHRRYVVKSYHGEADYLSGTEFISDNGQKIINWPKQHLQNGIQKNKDTSMQFKKVVRIFKNLNIEMKENNIEVAGKMPSYLFECLCWNTSNSTFGSINYTSLIRSAIVHFHTSTTDPAKVQEWGEINELKYLFRGAQPWKVADVNDWSVKAWNYIGF